MVNFKFEKCSFRDFLVLFIVRGYFTVQAHGQPWHSKKRVHQFSLPDEEERKKERERKKKESLPARSREWYSRIRIAAPRERDATYVCFSSKLPQEIQIGGRKEQQKRQQWTRMLSLLYVCAWKLWEKLGPSKLGVIFPWNLICVFLRGLWLNFDLFGCLTPPDVWY